MSGLSPLSLRQRNSSLGLLFAQCYERLWQHKALLELDDRMLADIGITKSQAVDEAKTPFWK
jgi:uncharacterized protein YjiS (DUF1127 family)